MALASFSEFQTKAEQRENEIRKNTAKDDDRVQVSPLESSSRSQHLNGNGQSVSRAEHSINQCAIGLTRGPFLYSVFRAANPSSVFLTPA